MYHSTILKKSNGIYLPRTFCSKLGIQQGDRLLLRCNSNNIVICKGNVLNDLDELFNQIDEDFLTFVTKLKASKNKP